MVFLSLSAMAKKVKSTKAGSSGKEDVLKNDVEQEIEVRQLLKDERTHKIAGTILLLIAFLLFTAFTSYLFTWEEDST